MRHRVSFPQLLPLLPFLVALAGCASVLADGVGQFEKGRYPEAKQTFVGLERESRGYADARRAEYALYRGLTLGALGDRAQAGVWLREAKAIEASHPGSLSTGDAARLKAGLEANDIE